MNLNPWQCTSKPTNGFHGDMQPSPYIHVPQIPQQHYPSMNAPQIRQQHYYTPSVNLLAPQNHRPCPPSFAATRYDLSSETITLQNQEKYSKTMQSTLESIQGTLKGMQGTLKSMEDANRIKPLDDIITPNDVFEPIQKSIKSVKEVLHGSFSAIHEWQERSCKIKLGLGKQIEDASEKIRQDIALAHSVAEVSKKTNSPSPTREIAFRKGQRKGKSKNSPWETRINKRRSPRLAKQRARGR